MKHRQQRTIESKFSFVRFELQRTGRRTIIVYPEPDMDFGWREKAFARHIESFGFRLIYKDWKLAEDEINPQMPNITTATGVAFFLSTVGGVKAVHLFSRTDRVSERRGYVQGIMQPRPLKAYEDMQFERMQSINTSAHARHKALAAIMRSKAGVDLSAHYIMNMYPDGTDDDKANPSA